MIKSIKCDYTKKEKIFFAIIILLSIIRVLIYFRIPYRILPNQIYDDNLMYDYIFSLDSGKWLGDYNSLTLTKGVSYPLFILLCNKLLIPYPLGLAILNIFSAIILVLALRKKLTNKYILGIIYILVIYSPIQMTYLTTQRLYRMAIIPSAVVLVFACFMGVFFRLSDSKKTVIKWAVLSGVSLLFFYYIREDSIWILPFVSVILVLCILYLIIHKNKEIVRYLIYFIPVAILLVGTLIISAINNHYYGVFTTNDRAGLSFGKMMTLLYKIDDPDNNVDVWLSKSAFQQAVNCSPTLASIENELTNSMNAWSENGEVPGDHATWAIRSGISNAGYYSDAVTAEEFCAKVVNELEEGYNSGIIKEKDAIYFSSQSNGVTKQELPGVFSETVKRMYHISRYIDCNFTNEVNATGNWDQIRRVESYTGALGQYSDQFTLHTRGWVFATDDKTTLSAEIVNHDGNSVGQLILVDSPDVNNAYPEYSGSSKARFDFSRQIDGLENSDYYIRVYLDGDLYYEGALGTPIDDEEIKANFDEFGIDVYTDYNKQNGLWVISRANNINTMYKVLSIIIDVLAFVFYLLGTILIIKGLIKRKYELLQVWLSSTGIILSAFVLTLGVTVFSEYFGEGLLPFIDSFYCAGAYTLIQLFKYIVIAVAVIKIYNFIFSKRVEEKEE